MEELAACEHERWSHWQSYMHSQSEKKTDGTLVIPASLVTRWERLMNTEYRELSEKEKESDREQVRRYIPILQSILEKVYRRANQ